MTRFMARWLKIYEDEIAVFFWTTLLYFLIRIAAILLNNFAETAFLKRYGVEYLPVVYRENTSPRNGRPLLSRRNGERKKLIFSKRLSCLGQFWQVAVFL